MMDEKMENMELPKNGGKSKFIIGGLLIAAAVIYLIASSAAANAQYFLTVEEVLQKSQNGELANRQVRVSGAVLGETIHYDIDTLDLTFTIAHVPADNQVLEEQGGLAAALHKAVSDPSRPQLKVVYNGARPDLLKNEAQAILTGTVAQDGVFHADELLLKCPTKYDDSLSGEND